MNRVAKLQATHAAVPIVDPARLDMLSTIVTWRIRGAVSQASKRPDPKAHAQEARKHAGRLGALKRALDGLTECDRRLLSVGLNMQAVESGDSAEMEIDESLTSQADGLIERMKYAVDWLSEPGDRERFDAVLRCGFVKAAARLFVASGFTVIGANPTDVFGQFMNALLRDAGFVADFNKRPAPFHTEDMPVEKVVGATEQARAEYVEAVKRYLS